MKKEAAKSFSVPVPFTLCAGLAKGNFFKVEITGEVNLAVVERIITHLEMTKSDYEKGK